MTDTDMPHDTHVERLMRRPRPILEAVARAAGVPTSDARRRHPLRRVVSRLAAHLYTPGALDTLPPAEREMARDLLGADGPSTAPTPRVAPTAAPDGTLPTLHASVDVESIREMPLDAPLVVQRRELAAQLEVARVLEDVGRRRLWTPAGHRHAPPRTAERLAALLEGGDAPVPGFRGRAWAVLLSGSPLTTRVSDQCDGLSEAGQAHREGSPRAALLALLRDWRDHPDRDALDSISKMCPERPLPVWRAGRGMDAPERRLRVLGALRALPVGEWVSTSAFLAHTHAHGLLPRVGGELWMWTTDTRDGFAYVDAEDPRGQAFQLAAPYVMAELAEVAVTLGVVDAAWAPRETVLWPTDRRPVDPRPHEALTHVRLTELGGWLIDPTSRPGDAEADARGAVHARLDDLADLLGEP